jgi:hypothetical protein
MNYQAQNNLQKQNLNQINIQQHINYNKGPIKIYPQFVMRKNGVNLTSTVSSVNSNNTMHGPNLGYPNSTSSESAGISGLNFSTNNSTNF